MGTSAKTSQRFARVAFALTVLGLAAGGAAWLSGNSEAANRLDESAIDVAVILNALRALGPGRLAT